MKAAHPAIAQRHREFLTANVERFEALAGIFDAVTDNLKTVDRIDAPDLRALAGRLREATGRCHRAAMSMERQLLG